MTHRVNFYADKSFFSKVKRILRNGKSYTDEEKVNFEPEETATLNIFAHQITTINFQEYERKSILEKIECVYSNVNNTTQWHLFPLQDIRSIDKARNWLTHFKNSDIGLINSRGHWVIDELNKRPKVDDGIEMKYERVERYYKNIRRALLEITKLYQISEAFRYLETEEYSPYLIG